MPWSGIVCKMIVQCRLISDALCTLLVLSLCRQEEGLQIMQLPLKAAERRRPHAGWGMLEISLEKLQLDVQPQTQLPSPVCQPQRLTLPSKLQCLCYEKQGRQHTSCHTGL